MASANTGPASGGRRRTLDAELNLVPFIDLLSMCICFLLMTAVWIQVGSVQVKQSHGTEAAPSRTDRYELELRFAAAKGDGPLSLDFRFKKGGKTVAHAVQGATVADLLAKADTELGVWGETKTEANAESLVSAAMIYPVTGVSYGDLVSAMDVLRKHHIVNLGVVPPAGGTHASGK